MQLLKFHLVCIDLIVQSRLVLFLSYDLKGDSQALDLCGQFQVHVDIKYHRLSVRKTCLPLLPLVFVSLLCSQKALLH